MSRPRSVPDPAPRPCPHCGKVFTPRNKYAPSRYCGTKCAQPVGRLHNPTILHLLALMEQGHAPSLTELGKALGVTSERVRQFVKTLQEEGRWKWPLDSVQCIDCHAMEGFDAENRWAAIRAKHLSGWVRNVDGWRCAPCAAKRKVRIALRTWSEDWPREGTVYWRVLQWMESGRPYDIRTIAKECGIVPVNAVSRAKRKLYDRGKWCWEVDCYRNTFDAAPVETKPIVRDAN